MKFEFEGMATFLKLKIHENTNLERSYLENIGLLIWSARLKSQNAYQQCTFVH